MSTPAGNPEGSSSLPERQKGEGESEGLAGGPSKNAIKKAQKEKEKAEKAAKRKEAEDKQKHEAAASDVSADDYGQLPIINPRERPNLPTSSRLSELSEESENKAICFFAQVENARVQSAKLAFLVLRQRTETIQAVVAASDVLSKQMVKWAGGINPESRVRVHGLVKKPKDPVTSATLSNLEIHVQKLHVVNPAPSQLPIQLEDASRPVPSFGTEEQEVKEGERPMLSLKARLDNPALNQRTPQNIAIRRVKDGVETLFREFLHQHGFDSDHTPKIIGAATEGGGTVFEVGYFATKAYLAQSPQFYKQILIAGGAERVMEVGSVFRAENSNTHRHLCEFTGLDFEMEFDYHYHEVLDLAEDLLMYIIKGLKERYASETAVVRKVYPMPEFQLPKDGKVPRLTFAEGIQLLRDSGEEDVSEFEDLSTAQEKKLGRLVLEKYSTDFYVLDQFPLSIRPFYTMPSPHSNSTDPKKQLSNSYDFFMRGEEIMSGAQRVHDVNLLEERMRANDPPLDPASEGFMSYVDAFRYGCPPHAGGGLGLERIVMFYLGLPNVRLVTPFPRDPQRLAP
ncbi:MAG: hypothetical protein M1836_007783 [Candelina mexicana]|nr:MAG: hypothetical protein M1836_007783 [Candelina mexicana]